MNGMSNREPENRRFQVLRDYDIGSSQDDPALSNLASLAASICEASFADVTIIDEEGRQRTLAKAGKQDFPQLNEARFFCQILLEPEFLVVTDTRIEPRFRAFATQYGTESPLFYAGAPLLLAEGDQIGALYVLDSGVRELNAMQEAGLQTLAHQVICRFQCKRQAKELLEKESALSTFRYAIDATNDGLWDWNIQTGDVHFSPQWAKLLGYDHSEVPPKVEFFYSVLHPDDVSRVYQRLEEHFSGAAAFKQDEVRLKTKSGDYRWFFDRGKVVARDTAGNPTRMVGTITDITERKAAHAALQESERELRLITNKVPGPVSRVGKDLRYLFVNDKYEQLFGKPRNLIIGREIREVVGDELFEFALPYFRRVLSGETVSFEREIRRPGEQPQHGLINLVPDLGDDGAVNGFFIMGFDITVRKQLEEQLRRAQRMEAIGQLASGIAHDFNNILAAILGNAEMGLSDTTPAHPAHECLEEIKRSVSRAKNLVQQILTFSRQHSQTKCVISLGSLITETARLLRATIPASVELSVELDPGAPCVLADATQIHSILVNLCTNSWHSLEDRAGKIGIDLQSATLDATTAAGIVGLSPGHFAVLTVRDNSRGIEPEIIRRIFDPFFTTKEPGKGTGLGLAVVHGIVQSHDGVITVSSQPGEGSEFRIFFPAAKTSSQSLGPGNPGNSMQKGNGERILFLDDEAAIASIARRMLQRMGYRVETFTDPAEARKAFLADPAGFNLVITDLNMPGTTGLQFASEIQEARKEIPILLCSGRMTEELRQKAAEAGIQGVLGKPSSAEELAELIAKCLAKVQPGQ